MSESSDPPAPADAAREYATARRYEPHSVAWAGIVDAYEDGAVDAVTRYLAACAAPGCGHEQAHPFHVDYPGDDPYMDELKHDFTPRSALLARAQTIIGREAMQLARAMIEARRRAEAAEAWVQVYREAITSIQRHRIEAHADEEQCDYELGVIDDALAPVVEGTDA